jgi:AcrR family transcriptional regulator
MDKRQSQQSAAIHNGAHELTRRRTDFRSRRTRVFIQQAFIALAEKRGFNRVSVQDIAKQAMINRATFYRYYRDKYYLAEDILKSALHKMDAAIGPRIFHQQSDLAQALAEKKAEAAWTGLFEHFASNSRIYTSLLSGKGSAWFLDRMRQDLIESFKRIHRTHKSIVPVEVARCFFASATIGVTYFWLKGGMKYPAAQVATWFRLIVYKGYVGTIAGLSN